MSHRQRTARVHGQGAVEYAVVLSLIAVVVVVAVTFVGRGAKSPLCTVGGGLSGGLTGYSKAVLADCPVAYWRMDETGGTVATDSSGNNHPGTYNGAVTFGQTGARPNETGTAISLDGTLASNGFMSTTVPASTTVSVEVWIRSAVTPWNDLGFISSARADNGWIIHPYPAGYVTMNILDAAGWSPLSCAITPSAITLWHQYVVTYDGSAVVGYLDGVQRCINPGTVARTAEGTVPVDFGLDPLSPPRLLHGSIDEASIYNAALTATQVAAHYQAATG